MRVKMGERRGGIERNGARRDVKVAVRIIEKLKGERERENLPQKRREAIEMLYKQRFKGESRRDGTSALKMCKSEAPTVNLLE